MQTNSSNESTPAKLLYRIKTAARLTDTSVSGMYNLISRGDVQAVRVGNSLRVPARELERIAGGNIAA